MADKEKKVQEAPEEPVTEQAAPVELVSEAKKAEATSTEEVDDLLDEIDEVLEVNAEDFVRSFVQKGGELVIPGILAGTFLAQYMHQLTA